MTELIEKGGFMMYPIMLSSVIALAVFIERLFVFASVKLPKKEISDEFLSSLEKEGVKGGSLSFHRGKGLSRIFLRRS